MTPVMVDVTVPVRADLLELRDTTLRLAIVRWPVGVVVGSAYEYGLVPMAKLAPLIFAGWRPACRCATLDADLRPCEPCLGADRAQHTVDTRGGIVP